MQFLTTVITLFAMCGAALGGPMVERGPLQGRSVLMFQYCDEGKLDGACSLDTSDNVNFCEPVHNRDSGASIKIYHGFECTVFLGYNCDKDKFFKKEGQYDLPDKFSNSFHSYKCERV